MYGQSAFLHMCCIIVWSCWKNTYLCNIKKPKTVECGKSQRSMAKHTKVKWTCPDCGSVNETMCNGSVTGDVICQYCGNSLKRTPVYFKHLSSSCNGCFELFVPNLSGINFSDFVCGVCGRDDVALRFKRFLPELTLTDTTITLDEQSLNKCRIAVVDGKGNTLAELAVGEQLTFGRGRLADVHLETADLRMSRVHFTLSCDASGEVVLSVDGRNGLLLNGVDLEQGAVKRVNRDDEIIIYDQTLRLK